MYNKIVTSKQVVKKHRTTISILVLTKSIRHKLTRPKRYATAVNLVFGVEKLLCENMGGGSTIQQQMQL